MSTESIYQLLKDLCKHHLNDACGKSSRSKSNLRKLRSLSYETLFLFLNVKRKDDVLLNSYEKLLSHISDLKMRGLTRQSQRLDDLICKLLHLKGMEVDDTFNVFSLFVSLFHSIDLGQNVETKYGLQQQLQMSSNTSLPHNFFYSQFDDDDFEVMSLDDSVHHHHHHHDHHHLTFDLPSIKDFETEPHVNFNNFQQVSTFGFKDNFEGEDEISDDSGVQSCSSSISLWESASKLVLFDRRVWEEIGRRNPTRENSFATESSSGVAEHLVRCGLTCLNNLHPGYHVVPSFHDVVEDLIPLLLGVPRNIFSLNEDETDFDRSLYERNKVFANTCKELLHVGLSFNKLIHFSSHYSKSFGCIYGSLSEAVSSFLLLFHSSILSIINFTSFIEISFTYKKLFKQIRFLAKLCEQLDIDGAPAVTGCELLSLLYEECLTLEGDKDCQVLLFYLLKSSCLPYFNMLQGWIYSGTCPDDEGEFIIESNPRSLSCKDETSWECGFTKSENVPSFLRDVADVVLTCGKSINLLKLCCYQHHLACGHPTLYELRPPICFVLTTSSLKTYFKVCEDYKTEALKLSSNCSSFETTTRDAEKLENNLSSIVGNFGSIKNSVVSRKCGNSEKQVDEDGTTSLSRLSPSKSYVSSKLEQDDEVRLADNKFQDDFSMSYDDVDPSSRIKTSVEAGNITRASHDTETDVSTDVSNVCEANKTDESDIFNRRFLSTFEQNNPRPVNNIPRRRLVGGKHVGMESEENYISYRINSPCMKHSDEGGVHMSRPIKYKPHIKSVHGVHPSNESRDFMMGSPVDEMKHHQSLSISSGGNLKEFDNVQLHSRDDDKNVGTHQCDNTYPSYQNIDPLIDKITNIDLVHTDVFKANGCKSSSAKCYESLEDLENLDHIDDVPLHAWIRQSLLLSIRVQSRLVDRALLDYFLDVVQVHYYFDILQKFVLLQDAQFASSLVEQLNEKLTPTRCLSLDRSYHSPHSDLFNPSYLNSVLQQALSSTSFAVCNSPVFLHLTSKLTFTVSSNSHKQMAPLKTTDALGSLGLTVVTEWPACIVIREKHLKVYNSLFVFLFKLKRVLWSLTDVFSKLKKDSIVFMGGQHFNGQFQLLHIFRHDMQHFARAVQDYVDNQVMMMSWREFQEQIGFSLKDKTGSSEKSKLISSSVRNLDELIESHTNFVEKCASRCLLNTHSASVMSIIDALFNFIFLFHSLLKSETWMKMDGTRSSDVFHPRFKLLIETHKKFQQGYLFLHRILRKLEEKSHRPHLCDLLIRLNFNNAFSREGDSN